MRKESEEVRINTNRWAHPSKVHKRSSIDVGEIETQNMSLSEKDQLLHAVAKSAY